MDNRAVSIIDGELLVYKGNPGNPPTGSVYKKKWWNILLENKAGYINPDAQVEEIHWEFSRKLFMKMKPEWLTTWKFPFFVSLFIAAIALKIAFRIQ